MDPQTVIHKIGDGGVRETARRLNLPVMTVHTWKTTGRIPEWRHQHIRQVAKSMGVTIEENQAAA